MITEGEIGKTKLKNIIDMALTFTAMIRLFEESSKDLIAKKLKEFCTKLSDVNSRDEFDRLHLKFCEWFVSAIRTAEKKRKNKPSKLGGPASYGQGAKILDIVAKVYVYYCGLPSSEHARRLLPFLHGAVDNQIMKHLKNGHADTVITATRIVQVDRNAYDSLQNLVAKDIKANFPDWVHPVHYDDVMFRRLNRQIDA